MDDVDEYQEWLYLTWGFGLSGPQYVVEKNVEGGAGLEQEQEQEQEQTVPLTVGERARAQRDLMMGAHPVQGERENDAYRV